MVAYCSGSDPIEIGDSGSKVKVTVTQYPFFIHNSLFTFLLCILVLLYLMKMKFGMSLRHSLGRFMFEFHKNQTDDDVIVTSFKFSQNNCPYLKFY